MNSEELRKQSQQIINEARTKTTQADEAAADEITDKIPDLIKKAIEKKQNVATVMLLGGAPKVKNLIPKHMAGDVVHNRPHDTYDALIGYHHTTMVREYELPGVAEIVFERCRTAGLNPYVAQTADKSKWGIGITW